MAARNTEWDDPRHDGAPLGAEGGTPPSQRPAGPRTRVALSSRCLRANTGQVRRPTPPLTASRPISLQSSVYPEWTPGPQVDESRFLGLASLRGLSLTSTR